ncbi:MAG TPA: ribosome silencing factor [Roseiarcus sp.]|nr:ribosome silencing factor [Roseiarcus sp.]
MAAGPSAAARRRIKTLTFSQRNDAAFAPRSSASRSVEPDAGPLARTITVGLEDAKAEDIVSIDLRGKTTLADLMVIASGRSNVHVAAIADRLLKAFKSDGRAAPRIEGLPQGDWVLLDANDAIVHIFRPEVRKFYNLEKLWGADRPGEKRHGRAG